MDLRPKDNVHVENWQENNFTVDSALYIGTPTVAPVGRYNVVLYQVLCSYYIIIILYYSDMHVLGISFYLYYTYAEDTSALFGYRTRYTFTLYYIISSLLLFIRAHRTADDTVLLEGRPSDVGANGLKADTRGDRMWRKKIAVTRGVECTILTDCSSTIFLYF